MYDACNLFHVIAKTESWTMPQAQDVFSIRQKCKTKLSIGFAHTAPAIGRCYSRSHHDGHARLFLLQGLPLKAPSTEGTIYCLGAEWSLLQLLPQRCHQKASQLREDCKVKQFNINTF